MQGDAKLEKPLNDPITPQTKPKTGERLNQLQIIHSRGDHWIVASTVNHRESDTGVLVYDSLYRTRQGYY